MRRAGIVPEARPAAPAASARTRIVGTFRTGAETWCPRAPTHVLPPRPATRPPRLGRDRGSGGGAPARPHRTLHAATTRPPRSRWRRGGSARPAAFSRPLRTTWTSARAESSLFDRGVIPWWTDPRLVVCFLRPLPSALVWADHLLFGAHAVWPHLHSLLWWALGTFGVAVLLRRSFGLRAGLLGTLVFALAPCHAIPLVWIANREALVSTALGVWALVSYERWREEHRPRDGAASLLLFALATLAGEYTLGFVGYAVAIELTVRRQPIARRALGVLAFVVPVAAYLAVHLALGYDALAGRASTGTRSTTSGPTRRVRRAGSRSSSGSAWLGAGRHVDDVPAVGARVPRPAVPGDADFPAGARGAQAPRRAAPARGLDARGIDPRDRAGPLRRGLGQAARAYR